MADQTSTQIHVLVQPYRDPLPERDAEIMYCLWQNLQHPAVVRVHALLEAGVELPAEITRHPKLVPIRDEPRLTFRRAFAYANTAAQNWGERPVAFILNADIHLDHGEIAPVTNWADLCVDKRPRLLTRFERHQDDSLSMIVDSFCRGNSVDAWAFCPPIPDVPDCDFRVGNETGCDNAIVDRFFRSGLNPINDPFRFPTVHIDKCAHRGRDISCAYDMTRNVSNEKTIWGNGVWAGGLRFLSVEWPPEGTMRTLPPPLCRTNRTLLLPDEVSAAIQARPYGFNPLDPEFQVLGKLTIDAVGACIRHGFKRVAFFGGGGQTRSVLPIWRRVGGPEVVAVFTTNGQGSMGNEELPMFTLETFDPTMVDAIILSSQHFESEMAETCRARFPEVYRIGMWHPLQNTYLPTGHGTTAILSNRQTRSHT